MKFLAKQHCTGGPFGTAFRPGSFMTSKEQGDAVEGVLHVLAKVFVCL